jgi:hypothetical protein
MMSIEQLEQMLEETPAPAIPPVIVPAHRGRPLRDKPAGRDARRSAPIHAYIGANGSGKSLAMVHDTLPSLQSGRRVLSTVELIDADTGLPYPNYERLTDWDQVMDARHTDLLFDEVVGIAGSREHAGLPVQIANILVQLRRRDLTLRWSAPAWARADKIIRETTQAVTVSASFMSKRPLMPDGSPALWKQSRLFRWKTYSMLDFDEWSSSKGGSIRAEKTAWYWAANSRAFASYRTLDDVSRVGEVLDSGRCAHCGGRRVIPVCKCDHGAPTSRDAVRAPIL